MLQQRRHIHILCLSPEELPPFKMRYFCLEMPSDGTQGQKLQIPAPYTHQKIFNPKKAVKKKHSSDCNVMYHPKPPTVGSV